MTLRKAKFIMHMLVGCTALCFLPLLLFRQFAFAVTAVLLAVAARVVHFLYWRCPHCDKNLEYNYSAYCQHCGHELNMDERL